MANGYTPISAQERSAYLEFLGSNPRASKVKDKDLLGANYQGQYEEVNLDDLYSEFAPNLSYYGSSYGTDTAEGYIANLVVQGYAAPAIKKEVDRLEAEGKLDSTRTKKDYYSDVDTFVKENRSVDLKRKQLDPYYKAGIPNPNVDYSPEEIPEFKAAVDAARTQYRSSKPQRPNIVLEADPSDPTGKRRIAKAGIGFQADPGEEEFVSNFITQNQQLLRQIGVTPYNDEILRRKGTVLGYGK
jgi:hypothetical protein